MHTPNEEKELANREQQFKKYLLELGLLTEITPPLPAQVHKNNRQPAPINGNPVSELVIKERR